jgi:hypothetical protein
MFFNGVVLCRNKKDAGASFFEVGGGRLDLIKLAKRQYMLSVV